MKKIFPFAIVIGIVSLVACSALGSCNLDGTRFFEDQPHLSKVMPRMANDTAIDSPIAGVFDVFDYDNKVVSLQTNAGVFPKASTANWFGDQGNSVRFTFSSYPHDAVQEWEGTRYGRGIGAVSSRSGNVQWISTDTIPTIGLSGAAMWLYGFDTHRGLAVEVGKDRLSSYDKNGLQDFLDLEGIKFQYACTEKYEISIASYNNLPRYFSPDYAHVDINIHVSSQINISYFSVELYFDIDASYPDAFIAPGETYTIPRHYFEVGEDSFDFGLFADDLYLSFDLRTRLGGNFPPVYPVGYSSANRCYLPYWEGAIDIYVEVRGLSHNSALNNRWAVFEIDTLNPNQVNCGGSWWHAYYEGYDNGTAMADDAAETARSEGYNQGAQEGYSQGYANGYNAGEQAVDNAGEAVNNLFGAIVNIPVNVLNGLAGFTIWSVPLLSIIFSFLFLGVVIWIVRKFI